MPTVLVFFGVACVLYALAHMDSVPIRAEGKGDLQRYHLAISSSGSSSATAHIKWIASETNS